MTWLARSTACLLWGYQRALSPLLPPACRFEPTCSEYARQALLDHGLGLGLWLALKRVARCHPLHPGGYDPPPAPAGRQPVANPETTWKSERF
ncbi:MAG: membrane protein insertion efficiency factor YidD [Candidatus Rokubacteria bacterium]|nr:membrane protein insertion efficiency factor YidD [Candidatus Rokubacteria bacterium]